MLFMAKFMAKTAVVAVAISALLGFLFFVPRHDHLDDMAQTLCEQDLTLLQSPDTRLYEFSYTCDTPQGVQMVRLSRSLPPKESVYWSDARDRSISELRELAEEQGFPLSEGFRDEVNIRVIAR